MKETMKALVFDSSSIITLALNNLLSLLIPLKKEFGGRFFITPEVKNEIVDRPMQIRRFELEALMISNMIKNNILEVAQPHSEETLAILDDANHLFKANGEFISIIHKGEASCLALCNFLKDKHYEVALVIDERTTRMLCENAQNLQNLLGEKLHTEIMLNDGKINSFRKFSIIRSAELCFVAYKKGLITLPAVSEKAIEALLYGVKFKGCSISYSEIEKAKMLVKR